MSEKFYHSLQVTNFCLFFSGIEAIPSKMEGLKKRVIFTAILLLSISWLLTDTVGEITWLVDGLRSGKNFLEVAVIAPCILLCMLSIFKVVCLFYNNEGLVNAIQDLKAIHPSANDQEENYDADIEKNIVSKTEFLVRSVSMLMAIVNGSCCMAYICLPLWFMFLDYWRGHEINYLSVFVTKFSFDHLTMPWFPIVFIHQCVSAGVVWCNQIGCETLFFAFCLYLNMHFRLLCHRLENFVVDNQQQSKSRLRALVIRHHYLIKLVADVETLYSASTLYNIFTSSLLICLSGFCITFSTDPVAIIAYFTFFLMSLSQISMLCYFGDLLMDSSSQVSAAAYNSRWYDTDQSCKKTLLLVLIRSLSPCKFTAANFADINLMTLSTILSRSWSYFTLLKTMYD